ncbi:kinesin-like protein KIF28 [Oscarella lobularis]|uniref:kinesin-like protein KIF28 n=1 Tax=Oscarella lobularis TaxID=121494 RepID=UPI003313E3CE
MTSESVKVAVRVRPFNTREKERKARLVIDMHGQTTLIRDPDSEGAEPKKFAFDYSYWSHDGFEADVNGVLTPVSARYADQNRVFDDLGRGVLDNAFKGYNCSLFAYGQTGSGKSYSMVGYGPNKGIVPTTCDELFKTMKANKENSTVKYEVTFSMLEIYNEQVRDLLSRANPKGGLPVRQNPKLGLFYVPDLKKVAVGSYPEIEKRIEEGTTNRTVASTNMNATSSRAHTVVTITFGQIGKNDAGQNTKKTSVINLVDLAGSERADSTGATGDRLKEGANINKSLSALGNVISALADLSMGRKKTVVPYRDSILTKLLQNALGGNSKTVMIAALSPADINYSETLSTLRYADRAKKIKTRAVVNENPLDKLIRELREENERLKGQLGSGTVTTVKVGLTEEEKKKMRREMEDEIRAQLEANLDTLGDIQTSWDEKLKHTQDESAADEAETLKTKRMKETEPQLVNLNEDPLLSGVIVHILKKGKTSVGKKTANSNPDLPFTGLNIEADHAVISVLGVEVTIKSCQNAKTLINGAPLGGERVLCHLDRIVFGSSHMYVFKNPQKAVARDGSVVEANITWEFAQKEIAEARGFHAKAGSSMSNDQLLVQEQIVELLPLVNEANAISEEMNKHRLFEVVMLSPSQAGLARTRKPKVLVKMTNLLNENTWLWERGKFTNRRYVMQDLYQRFLENPSDVATIKKEEDPFWDPVEDVLIGTSNVFLESLAYALDFEDSAAITNYKGENEGHLLFQVYPTNREGKRLDDDAYVEDSAELLGKPFYYNVTITSAEITRTKYSRGIRCKYTARGYDGDVETQLVKGTLSPEFKHSQTFTIKKMTAADIEYFTSNSISVCVYGVQVDDSSSQKFEKLTTKELKQIERLKHDDAFVPALTSRCSSLSSSSDAETGQIRMENQMLKRRVAYLRQKEERLKEMVKAWGDKAAEDQDFNEFYKAISAVLYNTGSKFRVRAKLLRQMISARPSSENSFGSSNDVQGSKSCVVQ